MREIKFLMNELVGVPLDIPVSVDGDNEGNDIENRIPYIYGSKGINTLFLC